MSEISVPSLEILNSLGDGVYVTNLEREITFWNKAAERITGWKSEEILGKTCHDGILCHRDKDGHHLCGYEFCPLYRSMVTGECSTFPAIVFAQGKDGHSIPTQSNTAPIRNGRGEIVGGVESFRDLTLLYKELMRAESIQRGMLHYDLPEDRRLTLRSRTQPHDVIGGDFHRIVKMDHDCYGIFLGDVMGHGVPAALYTMYLRMLFDRHGALLREPAAFLSVMNNELATLLGEDVSFAAGLAFLLNAATGECRYGAAGVPVFYHGTGRQLIPICLQGAPLGMMAEMDYETLSFRLKPGERLLFCTDGAIEIKNQAGEMLDEKGFARLLQLNGYPARAIPLAAIEEMVLKYSGEVRLGDDLTLIELTWRP